MILFVAFSSVSGFAAAPVVDALTATPQTVLPGAISVLTIDAHDPDCPDVCTTGCGQIIREDLTWWSAPDGVFTVENNGVSGSPYSASAQWQAPLTEGTYEISVRLGDNGGFACGGRQYTTQTISIVVSAVVNDPPEIHSLTSDPSVIFPGSVSSLTCSASDPDGGVLAYAWTTDFGVVTPGAEGQASFTASDPGVATITCTVEDPDGAIASANTVVSTTLVRAENALREGLFAPQRLAVDSAAGSHTVYVADRVAGGVVVLDLASGIVLRTLPVDGITSVAVDWAGNLLVGEANGARVVDPFGVQLLGLENGQGRVSDVAVDLNNRLYGVLHQRSGRVIVYDELGDTALAFGSAGDNADQLMTAQGLAVNQDGSWLVADTGHGQVKRFSAAGGFISAYGGLGGGVGEFVQLDDVAVGADGLIYATDSYQDWVHILNADGTPREVFGSYGGGTGQLMTAAGLAVADDIDRLLVASLNGGAVHVFLTGDAPPPPPKPQGSVTPAQLDFANQAVGTVSAPQVVIVENRGTGRLDLIDVRVDGPFAQTNDCGTAVDPGASCSVSLTFSPVGPGAVSGAFVITTNDVGDPLAVTLTGAGVIPPTVVLQPTALHFDTQPVGGVSPSQDVLISNTGTEPLTISAIQISADFMLSGSSCGSSLPGGGTCLARVAFAPENEGNPVVGALTVVSSAFGSPHEVSLDGVAIPGMPTIAISDVATTEGADAHGIFVVSLSHAYHLEVRVDFNTVSDTATGHRDSAEASGTDFVETFGTVIFAPGEVTADVAVQILDDALLEPDEEFFFVDLSNPVEATISDFRGVGSISDDEVCASPNLLLNGGGELRRSGDDPFGWTEIAGDWTTGAPPVPPLEGDRVIMAGNGEVVELIQDIDVTAFDSLISTGRQRFLFEGAVRSGLDPDPDSARILVEYRNWDNSGVLDFFDSGEVQTVDQWIEIVDERSAPVGTAVIRVRLIGVRYSADTSVDAWFDALSVRSLRAPTLVIEDGWAYEGNSPNSTSIRIPISLSCPWPENVVFDVATSDGTAVADEDYIAVSASVTLPAGLRGGYVTVPILADKADEDNEFFWMDLMLQGPAEIVPVDTRAEGWIFNDDWCTRGATFWLNHPGQWPVTDLVIGGVDYNQSELLGLLAYRGKNGATLLARQLVAVELNLAAGSAPWIIPTANLAHDFLAAHPPGSALSPPEEIEAREREEDLEKYNHGGCGV